MAFSKDDLGPFVPVVGYAVALATAVYFIIKLLWQSETVWQMPLNIIPKAIRGVITAMLSVCLAGLWYFAKPTTMTLYIVLAASFMIICSIIFVFFYSYVRENTYEKKVAISESEVKIEKIVGGKELTQVGEKAKKKAKSEDYQTILEGLLYNVDLLWVRKSVEEVKRKIMFSYLAIITLAFLGITSAALIVQVKLTDKPASSVISNNNAPGLENNK
jgi:hypothetical protein